ncbi:TIGR03936 family radical SAM-associated protein [Nocardioides marmoribigeumensis]|uniref:Radical SAM-linked protein n=1 Tax=Nocardioides marmoribigeumensis TaxID=433649 RepID=A0ABU2C0T4_9ACTN|nr:TIGR03936 family radical SAM-associated protein [Nocardioides marmoribigeumensis]MDR7364234.1 radical SAM-linked protein [Nocardioides marmoribigeumensis]
MRDQPEQQAPPVQRLRLHYAKRGRLRFTSHRDFSRAFERALVRAGVPMAYSSGFHPHPRISYAGASPTGAASEAEYLEIGLAREMDPEELRRLIDESLPPGLDVLEVVVAHGGSLPDRMEASHWRVRLPDVPVAEAADAVRAFLAAEEVTVERMTKRGLRTFDCRAAVVRLAVADDASAEAGCAILDTVLRHATPSVRPDDVLAGLREISGLRTGSGALLERLAQGPLDAEAGTVGDPLAPDRDAV